MQPLESLHTTHTTNTTDYTYYRYYRRYTHYIHYICCIHYIHYIHYLLYTLDTTKTIDHSTTEYIPQTLLEDSIVIEFTTYTTDRQHQKPHNIYQGDASKIETKHKT